MTFLLGWLGFLNIQLFSGGPADLIFVPDNTFRQLGLIILLQS